VKQLKEAKEALKALKSSAEATPGAIKILEDKIKNLKEQLYGASEETNNWKKRLDELGITTIPEKIKKIDKLKSDLDLLRQEYENGKLTLEDYKRATEAIESLSIGITLNAIPAARDFSSIIGQAPKKLDTKAYEDWGKILEKYGTITVEEAAKKIQKLRTELAIYHRLLQEGKITQGEYDKAVQKINEEIKELEGTTETSTKSMSDYFNGLYNDIATGWANTIQSFLRVIGEMIAEWSLNFIKNLISGATSAASSITSSLGSSITQMSEAVMSEAVATVGTSIGNILVSLSKAIATSAQILAQAAGAILKVGAVAVALYAAFKLVGGVIDKLLGGGEKGSDYVTKLLEEQNWVYL